MPRLGLGLGLAREGRAGGGGGSDYPIARRDLLREDEDFILLENGTDKIVITLGTYDVMLLEDASKILQENSDKFILTVY